MSDIKRYTVDMRLRECGMVPCLREAANGVFVLYSDHLAAMEALSGGPDENADPNAGDEITYGSHLFVYDGSRWVLSQMANADHEARIKALERSRLLLDGCIEIGKKHEERIEELEEGNAILDKEHVKYMRRTEALEKALNEHMVKERKRYVDMDALLKDGVYKTKNSYPEKGDTVVFPDGSKGIITRSDGKPFGCSPYTITITVGTKP